MLGIISGYLVAIIVSFVAVVTAYFKWSYQYWQRRNVPYIQPQIPFGNLKFATGKENMSVGIKRLYDEIKENSWKYAGIFILHTPQLFVLDLDILKTILTKDFHNFMDRTTYFNEKDDPLSGHLAFIQGNKWKSLRSKLTPAFTSGKMKMMFQSLLECEAGLQRRMDAKCRSNEAIDIKDVLACFTTDVIGSCAFGLECKAIEDDDSQFRFYGKKSVTPDQFTNMKSAMGSSFPRIARFLGVVITPKDVSDFFMKIVKDTVNYRETNDIKRSDIMQMLIDLKNKGSLTIEEVAAQCFVFFGGGFETSSSLMAFALYELARNNDIQESVREEVLSVLDKHDQKITYDSLMEMKYLGQVLDETLRKYPPAALTNRKCLQDYKVPGHDLIIEKGTTVIVPIMGIHHDKEYYPDPDKFDPDRFSDDNKNSRHNYAFLPFGEGPRICIGARFGLMQSKMGIAALMKKYRFTVNKKTSEPLTFIPGRQLLAVEGDIWLNGEII